MNFDSCQALIVRGDRDNSAYRFSGADELVSGNRSQWPVLEEALARRMEKGNGDHLHPPGAAVGLFTYEGDFHFWFCPQVDVVETEALLPEAVARHAHFPRADWREEDRSGRLQGDGEDAQLAIREGYIYQVNLARRYSLPTPDLNGRELFKHLWQRTEAPRAAYLEFPSFEVLSASPELFLQIDGNRIMTCPIKGTRPRSADPTRDARLAHELSTDPKENAELIMITDLLRHDLGQVCEFGSVEVPELVERKTFSHVHHLVSTIEGRLSRKISPLQALGACYPGGSITGAPKKSAMQIIQELEPVPRGVYTGAIGYFGFDGSAHFNIAIRTFDFRNGALSFFAGSGITADSVAEEEFEETRHKAEALLQAFDSYAATRVGRKAGLAG